MSGTTKTVLILVALMIASGVLIPLAYLRYMNTRKFRPPFEAGLTKNIQLLDDTKGVISLTEFHGAPWIVFCSSLAAQTKNTIAHQTISSLRKQFPTKTLKTCILLVDVEINNSQALQSYRTSNAPLLTKEDHLIAANVKILQKYLKNEFRFSLIPYLKEESWQYDHDLVVVDRAPKGIPHLRGKFDFLRMQKLDQAAMNAGKPASYESALHANLTQTLQYLFNNPNEEDVPLKGSH